MECPHCGASVKQGSEKCEYCGTYIDYEEKKVKQQTTNPASRNKTNVVIMVVIFLFITLGISGVISFAILNGGAH